jgi:hypothetical protein
MEFRDWHRIGLDIFLQARMTWLILVDSLAIFKRNPGCDVAGWLGKLDHTCSPSSINFMLMSKLEALDHSSEKQGCLRT